MIEVEARLNRDALNEQLNTKWRVIADSGYQGISYQRSYQGKLCFDVC